MQKVEQESPVWSRVSREQINGKQSRRSDWEQSMKGLASFIWFLTFILGKMGGAFGHFKQKSDMI